MIYLCIILDCFFKDPNWSSRHCSTYEIRRAYLESCITNLNQTWTGLGNSSLVSYDQDKTLEQNFYEFCSNNLTQSKIVSPAQEYFQ